MPVGLVPRLRAALQRQGYEVDVDRIVPWLPLLEASNGIRDRGETTNAVQRAFLRHPQGQVPINSINQVAQVIDDVARLYPRSNILVVAKNNHDLHEIAGHLRNRQPTRVTILGEDPGPAGGDIVLTTVVTGTGGPTRQYPLALYVGVETALSQPVARTYCIPACRDVMHYLLRLPSRPLTLYEELSIEALFGGKIHRCHTTLTKFPPRVGWLPSNRLFPRCKVTGWQRKQTAIWHNRPRNELIAAAASAMAYSDLDSLQELACDAAHDILVGRRHTTSVAILVESLAHAQHLQQMLPGWTVYSADAGGTKTKRLAIVTEAFAMQHGIGAEFVIRATAGTSDVERAMLRPEVQLIIDVVDPYSADVMARHDGYCKLAYHVDPLP